MTDFAYDPMSGSMWQNVIDAARSGGSNWAYPAIGGGTFRIFENRAYCEVAGHIYHKATPPSADYSVTATYYQYTDVGTLGIAGRISTGAITYYTAYYSGGQVVLAKMVSGALSVLDTFPTPFVAGSHTLRLEMVGTAIGALYDGATVCTATDSAITAAGKAGIRSGSPTDARKGAQIDTFWAGDDTTLTLPQPMGSVIPAVGL